MNCLNTYKRGVIVWHRKAGKDKVCFNIMVKESQKKVGTYFYLFPSYAQGKKILWDGIDSAGMKVLDHIPPGLIQSKNETELKIKFRNGSVIQIIGVENIDSIMGPNPIGCVFSEYSLQNPHAWDYIRPILAENKGWALFNFTPRGKNHAWDLWRMALGNPAWFSEMLTVDDTKAVSPEDVQAEREAGMSEDMVQQEFFCEFEASVPGSYFALEMAAAHKEGRICRLPIETGLPVNTFWDMGYDDSMTVWMGQDVGRWVNMVGYIQDRHKAIPWFVNKLIDWRNEHRVVFGKHVLPHDGAQHGRQTGKTDTEYIEELKVGFLCETVDRPKKKELGIKLMRQMLSRTRFDEIGCAQGIDALKGYRHEYTQVQDESGSATVWMTTPVHDDSSHAADGYQTSAIWHENNAIGIEKPVITVARRREGHPQGWMRK
jgi:hypothetical protein